MYIKYRDFDIYFSDLKENVQNELIKAIGEKTFKATDWYENKIPVSTYVYEPTEDPEMYEELVG